MAGGVITKKSIHTAKGKSARVIRKNASVKSLREAKVITNQEAEADKRAKGATRAAIEKARVCKNPVARYDLEQQKAYLEYADGKRKYIE